MEFPASLKNSIEAHAARYPMAQLKSAAAALSLRYREQTGAGKSLLTEDLEAAAYALTRMPATFAATSFALQEALCAAEQTPRTLLDVGAGTGAACWAAGERLPLSEVTCLEREGAMRRLGRELMGEGAPALRDANWLAQDLNAAEALPRAELVIASYALGEMTEQARSRALQKLWDAAEKMLLLVEPGTPAAYGQLLAARQMLLEQGAHLCAPCPHEQPCRLEDGDWCHFACRVPRSRLHKLLKGGDAPFEDEKFSYLAFVRQPPVAHRVFRVLRHPQIAKGQVHLELCGPEGGRSLLVKKKEGARYKAARKAGWGESLRLE